MTTTNSRPMPPVSPARGLPHIAEVVFNMPLERPFHYLIPKKIREVVAPGMRVMVPFGKRENVGFVVRLTGSSPIRELKTIRRMIDTEPVIAGELWALAEWLSGYYYCSLGEALSCMIPSSLRLKKLGGSTENTQLKEEVKHLLLSSDQERAFKRIASALKRGRSSTILLHGVTGSGKTELYLQAIDLILSQGRSAICLIPEIALTPQAIERFRERFLDRVAIWHSRLTARERSDTWSGVSRGSLRIVVGTRSAVFAPMKKLGLIIIDEEHEHTYKQEATPRYHAREVARFRAQLTGATLMLGSATPSIESYAEAKRENGCLITLPERLKGRMLPKVEVIDMREELATKHKAVSLSAKLEQALERTLERGEQAMLLLNRRGFARIAQCQGCGTIVRCNRCAVPLVYHAKANKLICHYCNFCESPKDICEECRKGYLRYRGMGTERIESDLHKFFPHASISRMDADTTRARDSHRNLYEALKSQQVGVLVGTQMIAKGHDFPQVTLVGVISADTSLNLPDFRVGERTFDLLTQVAGRAGRGDTPGRVLIQTYCPTHYAIRAAARHDYKMFYAQEIDMRKRLHLPPWTHVVELTLRGRSHQGVENCAEALAKALKKQIASLHSKKTGRITILGPAPHRVSRVRTMYRVSTILSCRSADAMVKLLRKTLQPGRRFRGMPVTVDVDPI